MPQEFHTSTVTPPLAILPYTSVDDSEYPWIMSSLYYPKYFPYLTFSSRKPDKLYFSNVNNSYKSILKESQIEGLKNFILYFIQILPKMYVDSNTLLFLVTVLHS